MTAITDNPSETNFLATNNFRFLLRRAPNLQFWIQKINLPGVSSEPINVSNQFVDLPVQGGPLKYTPMKMSFRVTENLIDYLEIYNWLHASTFTTNFEKYGELAANHKFTNQGIKSDIVVTVLDSSKVPSFEIIYHDAFPTELGEIAFESDLETTTYAVCDATFSYQFFEINNLRSAVHPDPNNIVYDVTNT